MGKIKIFLLILYSAIIAAASIAFYVWLAGDPEPGKITLGPVEYNTIKKDPYKMTLDDIQSDLQCFYNGFPLLDMIQAGGDNYMLSASLCERKWQRLVNIRPRDSPRNLIIIGSFVDSELHIGGKVEYYRFYGNFGIGGGLAAADKYIQGNIGVAYRFK